MTLPRCVALSCLPNRKVSLLQFTSAADTDTIPDYTTFSFTGTVSLPVDTAATQGKTGMTDKRVCFDFEVDSSNSGDDQAAG